jgi:hypothetical protein
VERSELERYLLAREDLLRALALMGPNGQVDGRKAKKLGEVAGFCEVILRYVRQFLAGKDTLRVAEFSCGKSYLGLVLVLLLRELEGRAVSLVGSDRNADLVEHCRHVADEIGLGDAEFVACRTRDFAVEGGFDLALALHACDTATDEAIAKGIEIGARLILTVPCCQNQIRGQIKTGHGLTGMTDFGPIRYRLANMLTDVLRAQFLRSAGYHVEMVEIGSPRLTPKNLCICARKSKRAGRAPRDADYRALKAFFGVRPEIEKLCPGVIREGD